MRISATHLESFRLWSDPEQEWMSEADLIATIRGESVPGLPVLIGRAFDQILETPERFKVSGGYLNDGFAFDDAVVDPCLALFDRRGVFQVKATKTYGTRTVVAKADQLLGAQLIENKTTLSTFQFDNYAESYQWRFMVDIFEPALVTYHVFCLGQDYNGYISLRGIETFNLYPYAALQDDCCELLDRFTAYVTARGLDGLLRERQARAEEAA